MKHFIRIMLVALAGGATGAGWAAAHGGADAGRLGLGVNLGRADIRKELDPMSAIDGFIGLDTQSASGASQTGLKIGGYYLKRLTAPEPVGFHFLGGLSYSIDNQSVTFAGVTASNKLSTLSLFGGVGAEYFLPGTKQLSIEGDVGLSIDIISSETPNGTGGTTTSSSTGIGIKDLTGGLFILRYYFAN